MIVLQLEFRTFVFYVRTVMFFLFRGFTELGLDFHDPFVGRREAAEQDRTLLRPDPCIVWSGRIFSCSGR